MDSHAFLAALRARLRRVIVLDGAARSISWAVLIAVAIIALDYHWRLPGAVRLLGLLALIGAVVVLVRRRLVKPLTQPMDDHALAQFVERRLPQLDGRLLTAVEGIGLGDDEAQLRATLAPQATATLLPATRLPRHLALAVSVLLALGAVAALAPQFFGEAAARLFLPLGGSDWTRTAVLDGKLEKSVVAADEKLVLTVNRVRGADAALRLSWLDPISRAQEDRQLPGLTGPWRQALALPPGEHELMVRSGDARELVLRGRVVTRPTLAKVTATLTPPKYLGAESAPQILDTLTCSALPGSVIELSATIAAESDRTLVAATISAPGAHGTEPLTVTRDVRTLHASFTVRSSGPIIITAEDQDGIAMQPVPQFAMTVTEDRAPVVSLSGPGRNEAVTLAAQVAIAIEASDDHALATLTLNETITGAKAADGAETKESPVKTVELMTFKEVQGAAATSRSALLNIADHAALGATLAIIGTATDANDVTGPGVGNSEPLSLRVVTPEELRAELDRLLSEAKDRVVQARDEIGNGLAKPERLAVAVQSASRTAVKGSQVVAQVLRRWSENRFPAEQIQPAAEARRLIDDEAEPKLNEAGDLPARAADAALAKAEKLLASLLQDGDLTRLLSSVIGKQTSLGEESRAFVKEYLTKPMDAAAKTRQTNLAERQAEIAGQMKDIERRLLSSTAAQLQPAQDLARKDGPGDKLAQAGNDLGSTAARPAAIDKQKAALESMRKLLDLLRGNDAAGDLAKQIGAVAAAQEAIAGALDAGARPQDQQPPQADVSERTKKLIEQAEQKDPAAGKLMRAAAEAQARADRAMAAGDRASASQQAGAAAALLREAQKKLGGGDEADEQKKKQQRSPDVMALLKELFSLQSVLLADAADVHRRVGEKDLDFNAQRECKAFAARQADLLLRLREEGIKQLDQNPIALLSVRRVEAAMDRAVQRLDQPALGETGMRLEVIALNELRRLIDLAERKPPPDEQGKGGGKGGGEQPPPFPPEAEIALLAGTQGELAALTAAGRPTDLAGGQKELSDLVAGMESHSRPGSRANLLLARTHRAMASAAELLSGKDRGLTTRNEQNAAEESLRRMLAEMKGSGGGGGGGGGSSKNQQPQKGQDPGESDPQEGKPQANGKGGSSASGNPSSTKPGDASKGGVSAKVGPTVKGLMELSPEKREQLRQARQENLSPRAFQLYQRYLELLEGK